MTSNQHFFSLCCQSGLQAVPEPDWSAAAEAAGGSCGAGSARSLPADRSVQTERASAAAAAPSRGADRCSPAALGRPRRSQRPAPGRHAAGAGGRAAGGGIIRLHAVLTPRVCVRERECVCVRERECVVVCV